MAVHQEHGVRARANSADVDTAHVSATACDALPLQQLGQSGHQAHLCLKHAPHATSQANPPHRMSASAIIFDGRSMRATALPAAEQKHIDLTAAAQSASDVAPHSFPNARPDAPGTSAQEDLAHV